MDFRSEIEASYPKWWKAHCVTCDVVANCVSRCGRRLRGGIRCGRRLRGGIGRAVGLNGNQQSGSFGFSSVALSRSGPLPCYKFGFSGYRQRERERESKKIPSRGLASISSSCSDNSIEYHVVRGGAPNSRTNIFAHWSTELA